MGLFDLFGSKKKKEEEEELLRQQEENERREEALEELKAKHAEQGWPSPDRLNPVRVAGVEDDILEDPLRLVVRELNMLENNVSGNLIRSYSVRCILYLNRDIEVIEYARKQCH